MVTDNAAADAPDNLSFLSNNFVTGNKKIAIKNENTKGASISLPSMKMPHSEIMHTRMAASFIIHYLKKLKNWTINTSSIKMRNIHITTAELADFPTPSVPWLAL